MAGWRRRKDTVDTERRWGGLRTSRLGGETAISGQFCWGVAHTGGKLLGTLSAA